MKNFYLTLMFTIITLSINAQSIATNELDKFTKTHKIETSIERLVDKRIMGNTLYAVRVKIAKLDSTYYMQSLISLPKMVTYDKNSGLILLLNNNETIRLYTLYTGIGAQQIPFLGNYNFETNFILSKDDVEKLKNNEVTDVRIVYLGGYYDYKVLKNRKDILQKLLELVDNAS